MSRENRPRQRSRGSFSPFTPYSDDPVIAETKIGEVARPAAPPLVRTDGAWRDPQTVSKQAAS
jgi:hypothetical protein